MNRYALRGVGPHVFISYSFKDRTIATAVADFLGESGCKVRMEDETSLIGQRLDQVLPQRIGDAEAFIQLRTLLADQSYWVAKELEYASVARANAPQLVVIELVLYDAPDSESDRRIAAPAGVSDQVLEALKARVLDAVHLLPLLDTDPFRFDPVAVDRALRSAPVDGRRIIVDSNGTLLRWMDDTLRYIESSDVPHRQRWLVQEKGSKDQLIAYLRELDQEAAALIAHLKATYEAWACPFPSEARRAMDFFALVRVGPAILERAAQATEGHEIRSTLKEKFAAVLRQLPSDPEIYDAYFQWINNFETRWQVPTREDRAAMNALRRAGIDDRAFESFVEGASDVRERFLEDAEDRRS